MLQKLQNLPTYLPTAVFFLFSCRKRGTTIAGDLSSRWLAGCTHGRFDISSPGVPVLGVRSCKSPWRAIVLQQLRPRHFWAVYTPFTCHLEVICGFQCPSHLMMRPYLLNLFSLRTVSRSKKPSLLSRSWDLTWETSFASLHTLVWSWPCHFAVVFADQPWSEPKSHAIEQDISHTGWITMASFLEGEMAEI